MRKAKLRGWEGDNFLILKEIYGPEQQFFLKRIKTIK